MAKRTRKRLIEALLDLAQNPKLSARARLRAAEIAHGMVGPQRKKLGRPKKKKRDVLGLRQPI